jgi:hypothetical protein
MRQHHATAAHADAGRRLRDGADHHFGARASEHRRRMVLGEPIAMEAELFGEAGEVQRIVQCITARHALRDGRLIEHGKAERG